MKVLILEDEIPAYEKLVSYLQDYFNTNFKHDWSRHIEEGKTLLVENTYDFILSDIKLIDGLAFDLFQDIEVACPIIFCSAYDEFLFDAFNTNGIAYILKPYSQEDFNKALNKYEKLFKADSQTTIDGSVIQSLKSALASDANRFKERFVIKRPNGIELLNSSDITLIQASGDFSVAYDSKGKKYPISNNIGVIETELSPERFFKVNRSQIINIEHILSIEKHFKNRLVIQLRGNKEEVMTSSAVTTDFRKWLEK